MSTKKLRFEIIIPQYYPDGRTIESEKLMQIRDELAKRFGGCNFMQPIVGTWKDPTDGKEYTENNVVFQTSVVDIEENRQFFQKYKETLKEFLDQKEIMITYYSINEV